MLRDSLANSRGSPAFRIWGRPREPERVHKGEEVAK
jgi:hypothetical protein